MPIKWITDLTQRLVNGGRAPAAIPVEPAVVARDEHGISRRHISDNALKVMARLRSGGFEAYLVGGCVRDLLLGLTPKDFDIATDAHPEQVRELFRNSRIIGRRFKIVHVRFGREIIEVTTFRGHHGSDGGDSHHAVRNDAGMLLRDNVYGTLEEDALRRDFTVNALYYTTDNFAVLDYARGMEDLEARLIRIIGDPETRYREDPVRMLRAVRFAAKLGFSIETGSAAPLKRLGPMLREVPPARMFDEVNKIFISGHGRAAYELMREYGLFSPLFPQTAAALQEQPELENLLLRALDNCDRRVEQDKPVTPAFTFAALLWPALQLRLQQLLAEGVAELPALQQAAAEVSENQQQRIAIPRRFGLPMREIWELQQRLPKRSPRRVENMMQNRRFRAAYDFLLLREQAGEDLQGLGAWWTEYIDATEDHRQRMLKELPGKSGGGRRRRRRKR